MLKGENMFGRKQIISDAEYITDENVLEQLNLALNEHTLNRSQIDYLWTYYRGEQPVLPRRK